MIAKALFKRFRSDPTNQSSILWKDVIKDCPFTESSVIKINECLARVGLKVEPDTAIFPCYVYLPELNKPLAD